MVGSAAGRLVVLDPSGRAGKAFPLRAGAATLGRAPGCDVRVLLPAAAPHHATLIVHASQVLIRNEGDGETLVNGGAVSVTALQHNDVITIAGRRLRWEYDDPHLPRPLRAEPALYKPVRQARAARRVTAAAAGDTPRAAHRLLLHQRASMPGNASGKQVAIVQPQRRDTSEQIDIKPRSAPSSPRSARGGRARPPSPPSPARACPRCPADTTQATLWIESRKPGPRTPASPVSLPERKSSPRKRPANVTPPSHLVARRPASANKATPLRMQVLRRARSAHKHKVTKIEAPLKVDHMKQAALMLMTGRTPRSPALLVKRSVGSRRAAPRKGRRSGGKSVSVVEIADSTAGQDSTLGASDCSARSGGSEPGSPLLPSPKKSALKDPTAKRSSRKTESIKFDLSNLENYSSQDEDDVLMITGRSEHSRNSEPSKNSNASRNSNVSRNSNANRNSEPSRNSRSTRYSAARSDMTASDDDITLRYSDTIARSPSHSPAPSPSPRRALHSRASTMLRLSGSPLKTLPERKTLTPPESPSARKSLRGSALIQRALNTSDEDDSRYSNRSKTVTDQSLDATAESAFKTRTLSPRTARDLESYSIVDLVSSQDSNESQESMYGSAGSTRTSSIVFGTPRVRSARPSRSTIDPGSVTASTPYTRGRPSTRSQSSPNIHQASPNKSRTRRSKSLTTPENSEETQKHISINSTRISRASKSRSRLNDSELVTSQDPDDSPRTSRRNTTANLSHAINDLSPKKSSPSLLRTSSPIISSPKRVSSRTSSPKINTRASNSKQASPRKSNSKQASPNSKQTPKSSSKKTPSPKTVRSSRSNHTSDTTYVSSEDEGTVTPENVTSPQEQGTPVLSIQTLLNSSRSSLTSQKSSKTKNLKRKTIGTIRSNKRLSSPKSKSFTASARRSLRSLRLNSRESDRGNESILSNEEENVTPKSGVPLIQEAVKNKHSTAKKPQSKRSIIDNLNDSDIVKQLFNSPVKRKLSQSMMEFSRKKMFEDEDIVRRPTRKTIAVPQSPTFSEIEDTTRFSPEQFVSPLSTPRTSPNLTGIKRLYTRGTPRNDLTDIKGVKGLLRSPRLRKSVKNDLTNVSGVKNLLRSRKSLRNDLRNVSGVKNVFAVSPRNDLRRVSGVKSLFHSQKERASPRNDLSDVRGVKALFTRKSAANDLRNVSGVKKTLAKSPRNDLTDVRGVKQMFRQKKTQKNDSHDLSGVEELFNESNLSSTSQRNSEALFDQLIGKPPIKAVYSKSFVTKRPQKGKKPRRASLNVITNNVEQWLENELQKHLHNKQNTTEKVSRALKQLATNTVEGTEAIRTSRIRNSTINKSLNATAKKSASELYEAHTLPIKKRSLVNRSGPSKEASMDRSGPRKGPGARLPLKKRVLHSTPVKGRANLTMNASELGRVSPIARAADTTQVNRSKLAKPSPKGKNKQVSVILPIIQIIEEAPASPKSTKKTRKSQTNDSAKDNESMAVKQPQSPRQKRGTRGKPVEELPTKTRAAKIEKQAVEPSAKKGRKTKANVSVVEPDQPKAKRGRAAASAAHNQPEPASQSPKPKGRRGTKVDNKKVTIIEENAEIVSKRTRRRVSPPSPQLPARGTRHRDVTELANTRRRRNSLVITKKAPVMSPKVTRKDTVKTKPESPKRSTLKAEITVEKPKSPRKTRAKLVVKSPPAPRPSRRRADTEPTQPTKTKKVESPKSPQKAKPTPPKRSRSTVNKSKDVEPPAKRGRNAKNVTQISPKKTRGNVSQESLPARSNRRTKLETAAETNSRKRKSNEKTPVPAKVAKTTRGRKAAESLVVTISPRGERVVSPTKTKTTRGKKQSTAQAESPVRASRTTRAARSTAKSPDKRKPSPAKKETPAKKSKTSPAKKEAPRKAKQSTAKKASPAKKVISSPAKKVKASPAKKGKATPAKKVIATKNIKATPAKKVKATPAKKVIATPAKKVKASPVKKVKASPAKKVKESPAKKTRGAKKAAVVASPPASKRRQKSVASPAKVVKNTRSRRR